MAVFVICEKEIILQENGLLPEFNQLEKIKAENPVEEYFEESLFGLKVLGLKQISVVPEGFVKTTLREYFATHTEEESFMAFRAKGLLAWRTDTKFCCSCGSGLKDHSVFTARECPSCGKLIFPRISPCIIVVIHKDNKILLVNHTYRNQDIYACVAGFMEAGESAEHAVEREVFEETGLKIKNIVYRGSQSWPFPDQLMLGFTADWESGDLKLQKEEIADAQWFDPDNCPASPKPGSIAYKLIHKLY